MSKEQHSKTKDLPVDNGAESSKALTTAVLVTTALLTGFGLVAIYAASSMTGMQQFDNPYYFFQKQAITAAIGFAIIFATQIVPFRWIERMTLPVLLLALALLIVVLVPGFSVKISGARRWLKLWLISGQPAEFAKLALVMFLAKNLSRPGADINKLGTGLLPNLLVFGVIAALIMAEPDFGTVVLLGSVTFLMLFMAGMQRRYILAATVAAVGACVAAVVAAPYRMARLLGFLDPWAQIKGSGFQIIQSYLAFQNGGLWGVGLGESQQKLFFLPAAHTDFILSVIGEELGLFGVLALIMLFVYLFVLGCKIAGRQRRAYGRYLAMGLTGLIGMQAILNMGVAMGLLPTTGIPLPFVSSGTSSLIVFLAAIALLIKVERQGGRTAGSSAQEGPH